MTATLMVPRQQSESAVWWTRAIRDVGFPAVVACLLLWHMLVQLPKTLELASASFSRDADKIVVRLEAMEVASAKQQDALIQLLMRLGEKR